MSAGGGRGPVMRDGRRRADRATITRHASPARVLALVLLLLPGVACMRAGRLPPLHLPASAPAADSVTVGLWHMDETVGEFVADDGPNRLDGVAGRDNGVDFGRFGNARVFEPSIQSFVFVPFDPAMETGGLLSIEAWVYLYGYGPFEDTPIAARWSEQANEQSWLFSVVGNKGILGPGTTVTPGHHSELVAFGQPGQLMFAMQPSFAGGAESWFSTTGVPIEQWTHVAVTYDGEIVRFYVDGRMDGQYVFPARIRASRAPLLIGNYFDPRLLSDLESRSPVVVGVDETPYYAFRGLIDELRISSVGRGGFDNAQPR